MQNSQENTTTRASFLYNKFAGAVTSLLIVLTWKSFNIVYRKLMKFFKVYRKKILRMHVKDKSCNRSSCLRCSMKKGVLRRPATLLKKTLAQVFSCEFYEISKNTVFTEHLQTTASVATVMKACNFVKRDFNTSVFLWIFQNFSNSFFYRTTMVASFELCFSIRKNFQQRKLVERFN